MFGHAAQSRPRGHLHAAFRANARRSGRGQRLPSIPVAGRQRLASVRAESGQTPHVRVSRYL